MITIHELQGAVFDLDDTLLDNGPIDKPEEWLHARSRLAAVHEAAQRYNIPELATLTPLENVDAFQTAETHSIYGAVWNIFYMKGLVDSPSIDTNDPAYERVNQIAQRKIALHGPILEKSLKEVPGATNFIRKLAAHGLKNHLAIASMAARSDADTFVNRYDLEEYFPPERIITLEQVMHSKPDPECFDLGFNSLKLPDSARRSVLAVEDNYRGVQSAKAAGLFVCAILTRHQRSDEKLIDSKPDIVVDTYQELTGILGM